MRHCFCFGLSSLLRELSHKIELLSLSRARADLFTALEDGENISLGKKEQACLLSIRKGLESLSSGLFCDETHSVCRYQLGFYTSPCRNQGSGTDAKADSLATATAVMNKVRYYDPGDFVFHQHL